MFLSKQSFYSVLPLVYLVFTEYVIASSVVVVVMPRFSTIISTTDPQEHNANIFFGYLSLICTTSCYK